MKTMAEERERGPSVDRTREELRRHDERQHEAEDDQVPETAPADDGGDEGPETA